MKPVVYPYKFGAGEVLDPNKLNAMWRYKQNVLADVVERRHLSVVMPFSFVKDCANGYSNSDSDFIRSFVFRPPEDIYITGAYAQAVFASGGSGTASIYIQSHPAGVTVAGATAPLLNFNAGTTNAQTDYNANIFKLEANTSYRLFLDGTGTYTTEQLDVQLHVLSDIYNFGAAPSFNPTMVSEASILSDAAQDLNEYNLFTQDSLAFNATFTNRTLIPITFCVHGKDVTYTGQNSSVFRLPKVAGTRVADARAIYATMQIDRPTNSGTYFYVYVDDIAGGGPSIIVIYSDEYEEFGYGSFTSSVTLTGYSTGDTADSGEDVLVYPAKQLPLETENKIFITLWIR